MLGPLDQMDIGAWAFLPAVIGFWAGVLFLLGLDHLIPHLHQRSRQAEGPRTRLGRSTMMALAAALGSSKMSVFLYP